VVDRVRPRDADSPTALTGRDRTFRDLPVWAYSTPNPGFKNERIRVRIQQAD
jgi:hypothetical protein